jgi:hypothetical protein
MSKFSVPAFVITDLLARSRHVGRRVALVDSLIAGAAGSVTFGVILGALAKPRQRPSGPSAPLLTAVPVDEAENSGVVLTWTATPGAGGYNVNRAVGTSAAVALSSDQTELGYYDDDVTAGTSYTYSIDALDSKGNKVVSSTQVSVTAQ